MLKELNAKAYAMIVKKDKVLNQQLKKQLKTGLIVVKIVDGGLHSFLFSFFLFIFLCLLFSIFYF